MKIELLKRIEEAATAGPWHSPGLGEIHSDHDNGIYANSRDKNAPECVADMCGEEDATFVAAARNHFPALLKVAEVVSRRPNKFGPHYMIWMDKMDAALKELEAVK